MKKVVLIGLLMLVLVFNFATTVKAEDVIQIADEEFSVIEDTDEEGDGKDEGTEKVEEKEETSKDTSQADTKNPQTGIEEQVPIMVITLIGICVAVYAGRKIKKYNY